MKLAYVGDGPRDEAMLPGFVTREVGEHERTFVAWHGIRLHRGSGYHRKLRWAVAQASKDGCDGVVAVVDTDGDRARRDQLTDERARLRESGETGPIAVGAAHPHGEAWLIDDLEPLRAVLEHPPSAPAPPGRSPKAELQDLIDASPTSATNLEAIAAIAAAVEPRRCRRARETGLEAFIADVRSEFAR